MIFFIGFFRLITPTEEKIIAVALFEDKELEKIILESDTETTYDSLQFPHFSQSVNSEISHLEQLVQSPEQVSSEKSLQLKPSQTYRQLQSPKSSPNKPYLKQSQLEKFLKHSPEHFQLEKPLHNSSVSEHFQLEKPPESSHSKVSVYPAKDANSDDFIPSKNPVHVNRPLQPELSSESDLEEDFAHLLQNKSVASKNAKILQIRDSDSEDTSDCDKNADFRFLTPTMFKKDAPKQPQTKFVYLSDSESNGSSIITTFVDSQPTDPSWKEHSRHLNKLSTRNKRVPPSKPAVRDKRIPQNKPVFQDKGIPENEDTSENENTKHAVNSENEDANCTDNSENKNTTHAVATRIKTATQPKLVVQICETRQRPVKKRKLYQPSKHPVAISYQLGSKQVNKKSTIPNSLIPSFFNSLASETNEVNQDCVFRTEKRKLHTLL
ncbi:uncharacterized protein LOC118180139 [Stegodyphus dumicola]|uniref:uncharacterized protein LOC118180139 n=1 Tax=Stegodyphus dumicola TaxID=202533 RepID=UPI0015B36EC1|nr:uncharacterized protein LOC118180139 [Stegodyphus dumicola]